MATDKDRPTLGELFEKLGNVYEVQICLPALFKNIVNVKEHHRQEVEKRLKVLVTRILLAVRREPPPKDRNRNILQDGRI